MSKYFKEIIDDIICKSKGFLKLPAGPNDTRPRSPEAGMLRYNDESATFEGYSKGKWGDIGGSGTIQWIGYDDQVTPMIVGKGYTLDTSAAVKTFKLPPAPNPDDYVWVADRNGYFATNSCFISGNGKKIMGLSEALEMNVSYIAVQLTYIDAVIGWKITSGVGLGAGPQVFKRSIWPTVTAGSTQIQIQYNPGTVDVYKNGRKLNEGRAGADGFTATNGTSIVLNTAALGADIFEVIMFTRFVITDDKYLSKDDGGTLTKHVVTNGSSGVVKDLGAAGSSVQMNFFETNFFKMSLGNACMLTTPLTPGVSAGVWYLYVTITNSATASLSFDSSFKITNGVMDYTLGTTNILCVLSDGSGTFDVFINKRGT